MAGRPSIPFDQRIADEICEIYALCDTDTGKVRYIGKARNSSARYKSHMRDRMRRNTPVYAWINKLICEQKLPIMKVLEKTYDWRNREKFYISKLRSEGILLNVADGGDEPFCSLETRVENGIKVGKSIHSDPSRKRIWLIKRHLGVALRNGWLSDSAKEKMRECARIAPEMFGIWVNL